MTSVYNLLICCLILLVATFSHVNSSELSMKAELEVLANKLLGEEQPLQNAEDQLTGIQTRLHKELNTLLKERSAMETSCRLQTERASTKLKATKGRLLNATRQLESKATKSLATSLLELVGFKSNNKIDDNNNLLNANSNSKNRNKHKNVVAVRRSSDDRKMTNSKANDLQESLQSEIEKDKKELAKVNHKIVQNNNLKLPLSEDALSALRKVYEAETKLLMDTTKECELQASLFSRLITRLTNNRETVVRMLAVLKEKKGNVEKVLANTFAMAKLPQRLATINAVERKALLKNNGCSLKCAETDSKTGKCTRCLNGLKPVSAATMDILRMGDKVKPELEEIRSRIAGLAKIIATSKPQSPAHTAAVRRVVATHKASMEHVKAQHENALAKIKNAVARAYMGPKAGTLDEVIQAARNGAVDLIHATHKEALAKIHLAHEASLNKIHVRHVKSLAEAKKRHANQKASMETEESVNAINGGKSEKNVNEDKVKLILSQHQDAMERVASQHHEQLKALRKDRKVHHTNIVNKHESTMDSIKEQHAKAIEELTAKEAEKKAEEQGAKGEPVLIPGPIKGSFQVDGKTLAPALFKSENLQVAAQSDFYRCKFMDRVVSGVMVRGKDPVTKKIGQYLKLYIT